MISPPGRVGESFAAMRLSRRLGRTPVTRRTPPERPVGVKLELTHRCNLRCGFCYTDSPRRTLERAPDLPDADWLRVVDEALELGVIEAVVTGGEPLLRRELALQAIERLAGSGVSVTLNTNGWFVDGELADRLARIAGLRVHVSIDGAAPEIHDSGRGVPGSWRRAVRAVDLLLARGVTVHVVHVVTPGNQATVGDFLDQMWALGVRSLSVTPVAPIGAASETGDWGVNRARLRRAVARFERRTAGDPPVSLRSGAAGTLALREDHAPAALLVRPRGTVLIDSLHPFAFGDVREQSLEECWRGIVANWRAPEIERWARGVRSARRLKDAAVVPYRDVEVPVGAAPAPPGRGAGAAAPVSGATLGDPDVAAAREHVASLALARRYRLVPLRWSGDTDGDRYVSLTGAGRVMRLNRTASVVLDALDGGAPAGAVESLVPRYRAVPRVRLERDVLGIVRRLRARGAIVPAGAPGDLPPAAVAESVSELPTAAAG